MSDEKLFRLDAEFKAAYASMDAAADRVEELEGLFQSTGQGHFHDDMLEAELKQARLTEAAAAIAREILTTRASSLVGMKVKLRVNETWQGTYEDDELLKSLVADIDGAAS
ncbi:hypothetical protein [Mesorhizobium argentiipisi]|uniref:Uncharacterized protein n=1 Tax=Mesorhizobium argentiipisi TaxID=3015175 RepID=A0ABU8KD32_9HYPH